MACHHVMTLIFYFQVCIENLEAWRKVGSKISSYQAWSHENMEIHSWKAAPNLKCGKKRSN